MCKRLGTLCPQCAKVARVSDTLTRRGIVHRWYYCECGFKFDIKGDVPARKYVKDADKPSKKLLPIPAWAKGQTEWRPYPFTDMEAIGRASV